MKRFLAMCVLMVSGVSFAQETNGTEPAAAPAAQPAAEPKPAETTATEVKALEPVDTQKDEKAAKSTDDDEDEFKSYSSIGLSRVSSNFDNLEPALNINIGGGITLPRFSWIAAELELSQTIIPGKNDGRSSSSGGPGGGGGLPIIGGGGGGGSSSSGNFTRDGRDLQLFGIGAFAVLQTPPELFYGFYGKGRIGYGYVQTSHEELNLDNTGVAYGIGAGWKYGKRGGIEFLYSKYPSSLDSIGLSVSYGFGGLGRDKN